MTRFQTIISRTDKTDIFRFKCPNRSVSHHAVLNFFTPVTVSVYKTMHKPVDVDLDPKVSHKILCYS